MHRAAVGGWWRWLALPSDTGSGPGRASVLGLAIAALHRLLAAEELPLNGSRRALPPRMM